MKNSLRRLVSILLALVLAFNFAPMQMVQAEEAEEVLLEQTEMVSEDETEKSEETEVVVPEEEQPGTSEDEEKPEEIAAGENPSEEGTEVNEPENTELTGEEITGEEITEQNPVEDETGEDELVVEEPEDEDLLEADDDYGNVGETVRKFMGFKSPKDIPNGIWVYDPQKDSRSYTSKAVVLSDDVRVYYNKYYLDKGTDYTITYKNNVNAGDATAVITGKGLYKGTVNYTYKIKPLDFNDKNISIWYKGQKAELITLIYNGNVQKPRATVKYNLDSKNTITLKDNVDYTITFQNTNSKASDYNKNAFRDAGTYDVTISGKGKNLTGSMSYKVQIIKKIPMSKCTSGFPSVFDPDTMANVSEKTFRKWSEVRYGNRILKPGVDYEIEEKSGETIDVIYMVFTATPESDFYGELVKKVRAKTKPLSSTYAVLPKSDEFLNYEMNSNDSKETNNTSVYDKIQLYKNAADTKDPNKALRCDYEYFVGPVERDWIGGKIVITMCGLCHGRVLYKGKKTVTIPLNLPSIANAKVTTKGLTYVGGQPNIDKVLNVTYKGETLKGLQTNDITQVKKEYDYYYSIEDLSNSKYKVRIVGRPGRFKGKKELTITLPKMNLSSKDTLIADEKNKDFSHNVTVNLSSGELEYQPEGSKKYVEKHVEKVTYFDKEKNVPVTLVCDEDYKTTWQNTNKAGMAQVTITGIGKYTGKVVCKYKIEPYDISYNVNKSVFDKSVSNIVAKGTPGINAPTINMYYRGRKLVAGTDYSKVIYKYADGRDIGPKDIVKPGTKIAVTINGKGNYTGSFTQVVTVESKNIAKAKQAPISKTIALNKYRDANMTKLTNADIKLTYNGEAVPSDAFVIKECTYKNNNKLGDATVVIEGKGEKGFAGTLTVKYKIVARNINR